MPSRRAQVSEVSVYACDLPATPGIAVNTREFSQLAAKRKNASSPRDRQSILPWAKGGKLTMGTIYNLFSLPSKNYNLSPPPFSPQGESQTLNRTSILPAREEEVIIMESRSAKMPEV